MSDPDTATYVQGHDEAVTRSHTSRTIYNSAQFLIPYIKASDKILDVGCGPGSITIGFAELLDSLNDKKSSSNVTASSLSEEVVDSRDKQKDGNGEEGYVIGVDFGRSVVEEGNRIVASKVQKGELIEGRCKFIVGDIYKLPFEDNTFDIIYAHQVTEHLPDPIKAYIELKRVLKVGGILANREADFSSSSCIIHPPFPGCIKTISVLGSMMLANGGTNIAGRQLHNWARKAGFKEEDVRNQAGTLCYSSKEERKWWAGVWRDRLGNSSWGREAVEKGFIEVEEVEGMRKDWEGWGEAEDGWFVYINGELIARKS